MHIHKKALIGAVFLSVLSLGTAFAQEAPQSVSLDLNKAVRMALEITLMSRFPRPNWMPLRPDLTRLGQLVGEALILLIPRGGT